jgi:hypothetical protein
MFAVRITSPHFCRSAAMCAAKASGAPSGNNVPCSTYRWRTLSTAKALRASPPTQSIAARGVPAGANSPN